MARANDLLVAGLKTLGAKPPDTADRATKQNYSQRVSNVVALAFAEELRQRGLNGARPAMPGELGLSGAERRMAGGLGPKRVDVTWATEESGLLLAISVKSINFMDRKSKAYQKNLTNRRGDMLFESVTLHRRFPYAVLAGFLILDKGATEDDTSQRKSTFENAHARLELFTGRDDPAGRDEQYERLFVCVFDPNQFAPGFETYAVGVPTSPLELEVVFDELVGLLAERNNDFYEVVDGKLVARR